MCMSLLLRSARGFSYFFKLLLLLQFSAVLAPLAGAFMVHQYSYPEHDEFKATLTAGVLRSAFHDLSTTTFDFGFTPEIRDLIEPTYLEWDMGLNREAIDDTWENKKFRFPLTVYARFGRAPLLFLIPGLGSDNKTDLAHYVAEQVYRMGYHVVIVPNNFHYRFAWGASRSGVVGDIDVDARDMYRAMHYIKKRLQREYRLPVSGYSLAGYSAGGYLAAALAKMDESKKQFRFQKVVALNPPINMRYAIDRLQLLHGKETEEATFIESGLKAFSQILDYSFNNFLTKPGYFARYFRQVTLDRVEAKKVVSFILSDSVGELAQNVALIQREESRRKGRRDLRLPEKVDSWQQYLEQVVQPYWRSRQKASARRFERRYQAETIFRYLEGLQRKDRFYLIHNADDFLVSGPQLIRVNRQLRRGNLIVYPHGGHLGNLWHPVNQRVLRRILEVKNKNRTRPTKVYRYGEFELRKK